MLHMDAAIGAAAKQRGNKMDMQTIVRIEQAAGAMFDGHGGVYKEQTEIGLVEASATSVKVSGRNGHGTYRTTWMLNNKRIAYAKLMAAVRAD